MKKITTIILLLSLTVSSFGINIYFSNSGNDATGDGSIGNPYATIAKFNLLTKSPGDHIYFNRGNIFYGEMNISQSGTSGNPIVIDAYGTGANPVFTGFTSASGWTSLGGNIWESSAMTTNISSCNMVVINGVNTPMGRWPNSTYAVYSSVTSTSLTSSSLNATTLNWTGATAVVKKAKWIIDKSTITSASGTTINYGATSYTGFANWGFFIQNDARTLDSANEWFYNPSTKKIRVYSTVSPINVQVATIDTLVGSTYKNYITISNIDFTGANSQAFYLGATGNWTVQNCNFSFCYTGIRGANFGGSSDNFVMQNCTLKNLNNNGISLTSEFTKCKLQYDTLHKIGLIPGMSGSGDGQAEGINATSTGGNFQYNQIDSIGYVGLGFDGDSTFVNSNFVNFFDMLKDDGGGLYTGNPHKGVLISNNVVLNGIGNADGTNSTSASSSAVGIYCDDYSSGMIISNNTVANISGDAIYLHNADSITVTGNNTYNARSGLNALEDDISVYTTGLIVKHNTFVPKTSGTAYTAADQYAIHFATSHTSGTDIANFGIVDSNLYARPHNDNSNIVMGTVFTVADTYYTLSAWRTYSGFDAHTQPTAKTVTDTADIRFDYNATGVNKIATLPYNYMAVWGGTYNAEILLPPYSGAITIKNGANKAKPGRSLKVHY